MNLEKFPLKIWRTHETNHSNNNLHNPRRHCRLPFIPMRHLWMELDGYFLVAAGASGGCMKLGIEKPDFANDVLFSHTLEFNKWFYDFVEPINKLLREGVEVKRYAENDMEWFTDNAIHCKEIPSHNALLINIQPVKQETPEDVLRDICNWFENLDGNIKFKLTGGDEQIIERAKRALGVV